MHFLAFVFFYPYVFDFSSIFFLSYFYPLSLFLNAHLILISPYYRYYCFFLFSLFAFFRVPSCLCLYFFCSVLYLLLPSRNFKISPDPVDQASYCDLNMSLWNWIMPLVEGLIPISPFNPFSSFPFVFFSIHFEFFGGLIPLTLILSFFYTLIILVLSSFYSLFTFLLILFLIWFLLICSLDHSFSYCPFLFSFFRSPLAPSIWSLFALLYFPRNFYFFFFLSVLFFLCPPSKFRIPPDPDDQSSNCNLNFKLWK